MKVDIEESCRVYYILLNLLNNNQQRSPPDYRMTQKYQLPN